MSYYLIDFSSNDTITNFDFDNIIIGKKIKTDHISKYYIYYQNDISSIPQNIYIRLPKLRNIYNLGNNKFNQLNIPIYPNYNLTNNFIKFITKLEHDIKECFIKKFPNIDFISIISKKNNLTLIKTNINDKIKITSDLNKKDIVLNDFQINSQLEIVIKLNYIWNKNDTIFSISSNIYQIKYYAPPDEHNIDFLDDNTIPIYTKKEVLQPYQPPLIINNKSETNIPLPPPISIFLTKGDLQKAILNLKPPV
jgi:hypothetical protein